ncbi:aspartic peptidase domain-containing protein [Lactifluus subvellereus]|nr:aspartic peptidase domain-containing protein [Lactifluus subvellereus]
MLLSIVVSLLLFPSLSVAAALPPPPPRRDPLHIPVLRHRRVPKDGEAVLDHYANLAAGLRGKYHYGPPVLRRAKTVDNSITNQGSDTSYFAPVSVGTPPQTLDLALDTGSSDLWFVTTGCISCGQGTPKLDPTKSTSLQVQHLPITMNYGSGTASGLVAQDTVSMGPFTVNPQIFGTHVPFSFSPAFRSSVGSFVLGNSNGCVLLAPLWPPASWSAGRCLPLFAISVPPVMCFPWSAMLICASAVVNDLSGNLIYGKLSGIMGLAWQGIASTGAVPFWEILIKDNSRTNNPEFSFFLTRYVNNPNAQIEEPGGVFTLGGRNTTLFRGNIDFQSFTATGSFWLQTVHSVTVNGKTVNIGNTNTAAIDTGTTLIGGPTAAVNAIWGAVPNSVPLTNMSGFYSFPCNTQLTISISFGGPSWPINVADLILGTLGNGQCLGGIFDVTAVTNIKPQPGRPAWIIGDAFLKNVYTVFRANPPAVGFAQLSAAAGGLGS